MQKRILDFDYYCKEHSDHLEGSFGFWYSDDTTSEPQSCREGFAELFDREKDKKIIFIQKYLGKNLNKLSNFFKAIEKKLKLKQKTIFYSTQENYACAIELSDFWTKNKVRRDILTILLRCGKYYNKNIYKAIEKNYYGNMTFDAIKYFLEGNTVLTKVNDYYGFVDFFSKEVYENNEPENYLFPEKKQTELKKQKLSAFWLKNG